MEKASAKAIKSLGSRAVTRTTLYQAQALSSYHAELSKRPPFEAKMLGARGLNVVISPLPLNQRGKALQPAERPHHRRLVNFPFGACRIAVVLADFEVTLCLSECLLVGEGIKSRILLMAPVIVVFQAEGAARFVQDSSDFHRRSKITAVKTLGRRLSTLYEHMNFTKTRTGQKFPFGTGGPGADASG